MMKAKRGKCFNSLRIHADILNLPCPEIICWVAHHLPVHVTSENLGKKMDFIFAPPHLIHIYKIKYQADVLSISA